MSMLKSKFLLFLLVTSLALGLVQPVLAHGTEPRLELGAERLNPGAALEVRGVDFEPEVAIQLVLIGAQVELPLGSVSADVEGGFLQILALPADLAEGVYTVRATTDDHSLASPPLTVWGLAVSGEAGEEGQRDEADGLFAPMPTPASAAERVSAPVATPLATAVSAPAPAAPRRNLPLAALGLLVAAVLGVVIVFGRRLAGK